MIIDNLKDSAAYISKKLGKERYEYALVLGSGLGDLADEIENPIVIDYHDIPHFPISTVPGHKGRLVAGRLEGKSVIAMQALSTAASSLFFTGYMHSLMVWKKF